MLDMDSSERVTSASPPGYKIEERTTCCTAPTSFMISDILDSSRRSPRLRSTDSEVEDDARSTDGDRYHSAASNGGGASSDAESGEREDGRCVKNGDDTRSDDYCGGSASPKSSAGSPGEEAMFCIPH